MLLLLHRLTLIIPPPPQKKENNKKLAKLLFCFIKNVHENSAKRIAFQLNLQEISVKWAFLPIIFRQNLSQIFQQHSCKISHFFCEFVSENPTKFDFFSVTYQRPCVMNSLCYKSSWSGRVVFFSLPPPPPLFFLHKLQFMSNLDQSYLKKVKVWITLYITSIQERTKCLAI